MAQWEKELATKPNDMVERTNSHQLSPDFYMHTLVHLCMYINTLK